jgi:stage II sporulation protein M
MNLVLRIFLKNWPLYIFILGIFSLGAALGFFTVNNFTPQQQGEIRDCLNSFLRQVEQFAPDPFQVLRLTLYENIFTVGLMYFLGLNFAGIPFILGIVMARGFLFGYAYWCLVKTLPWPELVPAFFSFFPPNLIYLPALATGGAAALSFALLTIKSKEGFRVNLWSSLAGYTAVMAVVLSVAVGAGLVEAILSPWLVRAAARVMQISLPG